MKILYYDCFAGISGDMNLGAMIDLGVEVDFLKNELARLPVYGYEIVVERDSRRGITGTRVHVIIDNQHKHEHEHEHNLLHGHDHTHHHHPEKTEDILFI